MVSSTDHFRGEINWDDVNYKMISKSTPYDAAKAYFQSKLANIMHANQLTNRLEGTGVSVFAVHPGRTWVELPGADFMKPFALFALLFMTYGISHILLIVSQKAS